MRNLKRALSLTLASVMLLGMMVIGTSAASYPDVDKDNNVEAIEVLQAVGVMQGDDKGNFDPDRTVSRNEMAIVMAKLLNLDYNYYSESCPFWDVPDYAKPYVGACFANGIVSGYSATQYGGSDTVTAVQAASMMMRALGYFQHESDYADGFVISTVRQASKIGLFKDINASQESPLTRDQVAQLALNTLESGMVEAQKSSSDITIGSGDTAVTINGAVSYVYVTSGDTKFNTAIDDIVATSIGTINDSPIVELGEKLYNGDLKKYGEETNNPSNESDDFGRPAVTWTYKNDKVGTYAKKNELVASYDKKVSKGDLYSLLSSAVRGDIDKGTADLTVHVNGKALTAPNAEVPAIGENIYARNNSTAIYTPVTDSTRRGTVTEVYVDKDNNVDIVIVDTFVYQATSDYSSSRDDVKIAPVGDTADAITLKSSETTLKGEDFDITDIKADDYLLITAASATGSNFEVKSVAVAEKVEGEVTAWTSGDSVTINGTKYEYSATALKTADGVRNTQYTVGQSAIVVVDSFGNIIAVDEAVASSSYVFVKEFGGTSGLNKKAVADAYFTDATNEEINVDRVGSIKSASTIAGMGEVNKWYTYSKNSDGKYVLYDVPARYTADSATKKVADNTLIQNGKVDFLTNKASALANDKTILVLVDKDGDVMTYTGTSAIPDVKNMTTSPVVYYLLDSDGYVDYAFVDLENSGAQIVDGGEDTSFMYVLRFDGENYAGNATTYYTYKTIDDENGEEITTNFDAKIADATMDGNTKDGDHPYTLYYKPRYNSDEEITNLSEITDGDGKYFDRALTGAAVSYDNGSLRVGANNFIVNNSSKIYLVARKGNAFMADSTKNHEIDRVSGTELESTLRGYAINNGSVSGAFVSDSSNVVDTMYITVKDSVGYDFDDVTVSPTALNVAHDGTGTFNVVLPAGKTATIASADPTIATVSVSSAAASATTPVVVSPVAKNGATTINVVVTDSNGISMTYQVRVTVTGFAAPTEIVGGLTGDLGDSFKDPRITDAQGNPKSTANVGETVQVVIEQKPAPVTRAVGEAATTFEKDQYYKVTLGADNTVKDVQCREAGKLVVEYQVVAGDLNEATKKITINVSAIVSAAAPVEPAQKYDVTLTNVTGVAVTNSSNTAKFTVTSDKTSAAKNEEVTLSVTLDKAVADGKQVTVTFTDPAGKSVVFAATEGTVAKTVKFTMGEGAVTVAATAKEEDASTPKNVLGEIDTTSAAADVSIKTIEVKDSKNAAVAKDAEMAAGDYTLVVTLNTAAKTTAPATVTLSGVTAKSGTKAVVGGSASWGSTEATETVVTIDAGSAVAEANTITYTFTVTAAQAGTVTITPVITVATTGANAKLEAGITFAGTPTWKEGDTVTFTSTGGTVNLNVVATVGNDNTTWTCTGAPTGYTADFSDGKLTLTAEDKADVADNPFGTITAAVSNNADSSLTTATVAEPAWTAGVAATPAAKA